MTGEDMDWATFLGYFALVVGVVSQITSGNRASVVADAGWVSASSDVMRTGQFARPERTAAERSGRRRATGRSLAHSH